MTGHVFPLVHRALQATLVLLVATAPLSISISQSALGLAVLLGACIWFRGGPPVRTGLEWLALALVGWAMLMVPFSGAPLVSLVFLKRFYLLAGLWLLATHATGRGLRVAVLIALAASGAWLGISGIEQYLRWGGTTYYTDAGEIMGRITLLHNAITGGELVMLIGLALVPFLLVPLRWWARGLVALALVLVVIVLILNLTRSAWLGFALGAGVVVLLARPRLLPLAVVVLVVAVVVMPPAFRTRLVSTFDPTHEHNAQRWYMWQTGWELVRQHPLTGAGDRDLGLMHLSIHAGNPAVEKHGHLHSNLVQFAAIWGIPGLLVGTVFLCAIPVVLWKRWRELRRLRERAPPLARGWVLAGIGAWIGFFVVGLFEWNFGDAEVVLLLWLIVGMGLARPAVEPAAQPTD